MPRVKRSVHARKKRAKVLEAAKGYVGRKALDLPRREGAGRALARLRVSRPEGEEAQLPPALDHPDQRCGARRGPLVQPVRRGLPQGGHRARSQGARRARRERPGGVRQDRRAGEGRARALSADAARAGLPPPGGAVRAHGLAALRRACAGGWRVSRAVREILDDARWDRPLQLLGGLHYLALSEGVDPGAIPHPSRGASRLAPALRRTPGRADERGPAQLDAPARASSRSRAGPASRPST